MEINKLGMKQETPKDRLIQAQQDYIYFLESSMRNYRKQPSAEEILQGKELKASISEAKKDIEAANNERIIDSYPPVQSL